MTQKSWTRLLQPDQSTDQVQLVRRGYIATFDKAFRPASIHLSFLKNLIVMFRDDERVIYQTLPLLLVDQNLGQTGNLPRTSCAPCPVQTGIYCVPRREYI